MYVKCEKRGMNIEGEWVPKGSSKKITEETVELLKASADQNIVTLHSRDPLAKKASARKARKAPGLESVEKSVKADKEQKAEK